MVWGEHDANFKQLNSQVGGARVEFVGCTARTRTPSVIWLLTVLHLQHLAPPSAAEAGV